MTNEQGSKRRFITRFFDNAESRVAYLTELFDAGREPEALTLCLTYIDSFAQWLCWPSVKTGRNFVDALIQFGGCPLMGLAHPMLASRIFSEMNSEWRTIGEKIGREFVGGSVDVITMLDFESRLGLHLTPAEFERAKDELWRSTIANAVYRRLRNPSVHNFGSAGGILFSQTTYQGAPFPAITFWQLRDCARGLVSEARRLSVENWQWFGKDKTVVVE